MKIKKSSLSIAVIYALVAWLGACGPSASESDLAASAEISSSFSIQKGSGVIAFETVVEGPDVIVIDPDQAETPPLPSEGDLENTGGDMGSGSESEGPNQNPDDDLDGGYCIVVKSRGTTAAWITLNDDQLFQPDSFKKSVTVLKKTIDLGESNTLSVRIAGKPGSQLDIAIYNHCEEKDQILLGNLEIVRSTGKPQEDSTSIEK